MRLYIIVLSCVATKSSPSTLLFQKTSMFSQLPFACFFFALSYLFCNQSKRGRLAASSKVTAQSFRDRLRVAQLLPQSMERLRKGLRTLGLVSPRRTCRFLRRATRFLVVSYRLCYTVHLILDRSLVTLASTYLLPSVLARLSLRFQRHLPRSLARHLLYFPSRLRVCFSVRRWRCK